MTRPADTPKIFKLTVDCFDDIFEYLSLDDLVSFGEASKTTQKVAGQYFQRKYSSAALQIYKDSSLILLLESTDYFAVFNEFLTKVKILVEENSFEFFSIHINEFPQIKELKVRTFDHDNRFYKQAIEAMPELCPKLEAIDLISADVPTNFYDTMLKYCVNLKRLHINAGPWIRQDYPKLQHLQIPTVGDIHDLDVFFQKNPNIRCFSTSAEGIWKMNSCVLMCVWTYWK